MPRGVPGGLDIENTKDPDVQPGAEGGPSAGDLLGDKPGGGFLAALLKILGFGDPEAGKKVGASLGATGLSLLLNRPSSQSKKNQGLLNQAAGTEAAALQQRTDLIKKIIDFLQTGEGLGQVRTGPVFQFTDDAGGPANDLAFLQGIQPGIARKQQLDMLMRLAGADVGTGNLSLAGQLSAQDERLRQQSISSTVGGLLEALLLSVLRKDSEESGGG